MSASPEGQHYRVRVFVDFWNYTLAMRHTDAAFRSLRRWQKLCRHEIDAIAEVERAEPVTPVRQTVER